MDKTDKTIALYYEREAETGPAGPGRCVAKCPRVPSQQQTYENFLIVQQRKTEGRQEEPGKTQELYIPTQPVQKYSLNRESSELGPQQKGIYTRLAEELDEVAKTSEMLREEFKSPIDP